MGETHRVALLTDDDLPAAVDVFARAFADAGMTQLITSDPGKADRMLRKEARTHLRRFRRYGHVFGAFDGERLRGVALWLPPGVRVSDVVIPPADVLPGVLGMLARSRFAVVAFGVRRARAVARAAPGRWHLAFLATDPEHQGRGVGRRLLEHVLDRLDGDGASAWLECERPNVALYERFGFTVVGSYAVRRLPQMLVMQRDPAILVG